MRSITNCFELFISTQPRSNRRFLDYQALRWGTSHVSKSRRGAPQSIVVKHRSNANEFALDFARHPRFARRGQHIDLATDSELRQINPRLDREAGVEIG